MGLKEYLNSPPKEPGPLPTSKKVTALEEHRQGEKVKKEEEKKGYSHCADNHPPLPILVDGKVYEIHGGSSTRKAPPEDVEVFIGFDHGMVQTDRRFPWDPRTEFLYPITDMGVPPDLASFEKLLDYLAKEVMAQRKVFIGCIGGHGRTGLVLAALVQRMTGEEDAITFVRNHYCKKVVESEKQVDWLHKHFGIKKVQGSKAWGGSTASKVSAHSSYHGDEPWDAQDSVWPSWLKPKASDWTTVPFVNTNGSIHGKNTVK